jgi:hypothetical protein
LLQVLLEKGCEESRIFFLCLVAAPQGIHKLCTKHPQVRALAGGRRERRWCGGGGGGGGRGLWDWSGLIPRPVLSRRTAAAPSPRMQAWENSPTLPPVPMANLQVTIITSEIDSTLDANLIVVPGVGEFGNRYFCDS